MNKYSVYISGRVSKVYEVEADSREDAMVEALEFFNEFASENYTDNDVTSQIFTDVEELPIEEDNNTKAQALRSPRHSFLFRQRSRAGPHLRPSRSPPPLGIPSLPAGDPRALPASAREDGVRKRRHAGR